MITYSLNLNELLLLKDELLRSYSNVLINDHSMHGIKPELIHAHQEFIKNIYKLKIDDIESRIKIEKSMRYELAAINKTRFNLEGADTNLDSLGADSSNDISMLEQQRSIIYSKLLKAHKRLVLEKSSGDQGSANQPNLINKLLDYIDRQERKILSIRKSLYFLYGKLPIRKTYLIALQNDFSDKSVRNRVSKYHLSRRKNQPRFGASSY